MNDDGLLQQIHMAQVEAGENVVVEDLHSKGLLPPQTSALIPLDELQRQIDEFCDFKAGDSTDGLQRLFLRGFMDWMREREDKK